MPSTDPLVVAISSRALFDLEESHQVFEKEGTEAYCTWQIEHEEELLRPGMAFPLVRKLLALNSSEQRRVEVILLSRNSADTGLRVFNSIQHHGLDITRAAFTSGTAPYRYAASFGAKLFLSANAEDARAALDAGLAAATILPGVAQPESDAILRFAFDGDAVLWSDEAEQIFQRDGLTAFAQSEKAAAHRPLGGGPFKPFLAALHRLQSSYPPDDSPIRTALITARSAPAHERVIRTLRSWRIRIDEAMFLGGKDKGEFLHAFGADLFFDDQFSQCVDASRYVVSGHVPHGVKNR